jgi:hypothetical protein
LLRAPLGMEKDYPSALTYDMKRIAARMQASGFPCSIHDYPSDYWSRDFRRTRSNLVISVPGESRPLAREMVTAKAG